MRETSSARCAGKASAKRRAPSGVKAITRLPGLRRAQSFASIASRKARPSLPPRWLRRALQSRHSRHSGGRAECKAAGRAGLFAGYRLRVAEVLRDYGLAEREQAPPDSRAAHP